MISDLSALEAQVQIAETDRPKVKQGQTVELTFNAVPDLTITGKVAEIDAVGTSSSGVVTYGVTITFDVQNPQLSPGMTAAASIVTDVRQRRGARAQRRGQDRQQRRQVRPGARPTRTAAARRDRDGRRSRTTRRRRS